MWGHEGATIGLLEIDKKEIGYPCMNLALIICPMLYFLNELAIKLNKNIAKERFKKNKANLFEQ